MRFSTWIIGGVGQTSVGGGTDARLTRLTSSIAQSGKEETTTTTAKSSRPRASTLKIFWVNGDIDDGDLEGEREPDGDEQLHVGEEAELEDRVRWLRQLKAWKSWLAGQGEEGRRPGPNDAFVFDEEDEGEAPRGAQTAMKRPLER